MRTFSTQQHVDMALVCEERAAKARRIAESINIAITKAAFIELEKRWLALAQNYRRIKKPKTLTGTTSPPAT